MTVFSYFVAVLVVVLLGVTCAKPIHGHNVLQLLESFRTAKQGHFMNVPASQPNGVFSMVQQKSKVLSGNDITVETKNTMKEVLHASLGNNIINKLTSDGSSQVVYMGDTPMSNDVEHYLGIEKDRNEKDDLDESGQVTGPGSGSGSGSGSGDRMGLDIDLESGSGSGSGSGDRMGLDIDLESGSGSGSGSGDRMGLDTDLESGSGSGSGSGDIMESGSGSGRRVDQE